MAQRYTGRQRAYSSLSADLEEFAKESESRMLAVVRSSINDVVNEMQQPVAKGGRMRVDTGFLRNSGRAGVGSMPSGPADRPADAVRGQYQWSEDNLVSVLSKLKIGDVFYWGWTANYARYRELYDGFMEAALMQWSRIVAFNTDTLKQRIKK